MIHRKIEHGTKRKNRLTRYLPALALAVLALLCARPARAALEIEPKIRVAWYYNDNLYSQDPNELIKGQEIAKASYINYLLGVYFRLWGGRHTLWASGYGGYTEYVTIAGWVEKAPENQAGDYNSVSLNFGAGYRYTGNRIVFELSDHVNVTRDLREIFGPEVDIHGFWSLYTNNVISASLSYNPTTRLRLLGRYDYDTLVFATPENDITPPPDSVEQRLFLVGEYDVTSRLAAIVDFQWYGRTYRDVTEPLTGQELTYADYVSWQTMAGARYTFNANSSLKVMIGYAPRTFNNISSQTTPVPPYPQAVKMYDVENFNSPTVDVAFVNTRPNRYRLALAGKYGVSTYGENLYFNFWSTSANLTYYLAPTLYAGAFASYGQSYFDLERNGREWLWNDDRTDNLVIATLSMTWDLFQKSGQGTLSLSGGYTLRTNDSNIDNMNDYTPEYQIWRGPAGYYNSYDNTVNLFYIQVEMLPRLLLGG